MLTRRNLLQICQHHQKDLHLLALQLLYKCHQTQDHLAGVDQLGLRQSQNVLDDHDDHDTGDHVDEEVSHNPDAAAHDYNAVDHVDDAAVQNVHVSPHGRFQKHCK